MLAIKIAPEPSADVYRCISIACSNDSERIFADAMIGGLVLYDLSTGAPAHPLILVQR
jgi:hypothetical protein